MHHRAQRHSTGRGKPFRRRPKQLSLDPALYEHRGGGQGLVMVGGPHRAGRTPGSGAGAGPGQTDEPAEVLHLADLDASGPVADAEVRRRAREIAARLSVPRPRRRRAPRRGLGRLQSLPYRDGAEELDLDRTVEILAEDPFARSTALVMRDRIRDRRKVVLVVDISGSMRGERIRTAAAAVGAMAGEFGHDDLAVVAFWSEAAVLSALGEPVSPAGLVDLLLRIPSKGLTNVGFALEVARGQLRDVPADEGRVLLLSDCVHNAGPDPRTAAARLPRLDVLADISGEHDLLTARDLARAGRGLALPIRRHRDVAAAISREFGA
ncbi:VWA domain-containing protein [Rhodococcus sp. CSLK01-03]|uniref:VWA domain-containing protein n=1 Tax=Rhodococcus indonesiensis TaxID=3055869 RepID=A0ABT7RRP3_9NOCA|nr:VWA domain-containing protein [Rhodococcus indonesiensis]MDM7490310.1 VWA domain-containing protein [Rhodococcus indonesiensis]